MWNTLVNFKGSGRLKRLLPIFGLSLLLCCGLSAQSTSKLRVRPHILGIAHVGFEVSDLGMARSFYRNSLGFETPLSVNHPDGSDSIGYIKIEQQQYVQLLGNSTRPEGSFNNIGFYTDDVAAMRTYLLAHHVTLVRDVHQAPTGDAFLSFKDPDGRLVEIVKYKAGGLTTQARTNGGKRDHIARVGLPGGLSDAARLFYIRVLGFQSRTEGQSSPATLRVPDGTDLVEFPLSTEKANESCQIVLSSGKSLCREL